MEATATPRRSILGIVRTLKDDVRQLLRQELDLAKTEVSEKIALFGRNAVAVAAGGSVAYAGLIVFLMGLGWLVAWALEQAGLQSGLAGFLGLAIVGLLAIGAGAAVLLKGLKSFSKQSLAPQKTIYTIQRLKSDPETASAPQPREETKRTSKEIQAQVEETGNRMNDALDELGERLSPRYIKAQVTHRIQEKPYRSGLVALAAGLLSGFFLTRASRRS